MCKRIILFVFIVVSSLQLHGQSYDVLNYSYNGTPKNGIKIVTNIPYRSQSQMPTLTINGYIYGKSKTIGLQLSWYIYAGEFIHQTVSSFGAHAPDVYLANENGKVVVFLDDRQYFPRFKITAYAKGMSEQPEWFAGWTVEDAPISGTNKVAVPYKNTLPGETHIAGGIITRDGKMGLGTLSPNATLDVKGLTRIKHNSNDLYALKVRNGGGSALGVEITGGANSPTPLLNVHSDYVGGNRNGLAVLSNGRVGIGTLSPQYKLSVKGRIACNEVLVEDVTNWPDFVFAKDYALMSLPDLKAFVREHKHLPNMPSEREVKQEGVSLNEMNKKLLQKVEELTLYVLQLKEENKEQNQQIETLLKKLENK